MSKQHHRGFTADDLANKGFVEHPEGSGKYVHKSQISKPTVIRKETIVSNDPTKMITTFDTQQPQVVPFDQINKIGGTTEKAYLQEMRDGLLPQIQRPGYDMSIPMPPVNVIECEGVQYDMTGIVVFNIIPKPKPRFNGKDLFGRKHARPIIIKYWDWCEKLNRIATRIGYTITETMHITFYMPISKAAKKRGVKDGDPYKKKPDNDNMQKAFNDALTSERYGKRTAIGDEHIWDVRATKRYSDHPRIEIKPLQD